MKQAYSRSTPLNTLDTSFSEKKEIIHIYALRINKLLDYYYKQLNRLSSTYHNHNIDDENFKRRSEGLLLETKTVLSTLFIEQFYNTGDYNLFDRALHIDEQVKLMPRSIININEADMYDDTLNFVVFYKGILFPLTPKESAHKPHLKLLVRDEDIVSMINDKLDRARQILEIDEITLGKKYYDGLCHRSHFWHK